MALVRAALVERQLGLEPLLVDVARGGGVGEAGFGGDGRVAVVVLDASVGGVEHAGER